MRATSTRMSRLTTAGSVASPRSSSEHRSKEGLHRRYLCDLVAFLHRDGSPRFVQGHGGQAVSNSAAQRAKTWLHGLFPGGSSFWIAGPALLELVLDWRLAIIAGRTAVFFIR